MNEKDNIRIVNSHTDNSIQSSETKQHKHLQSDDLEHQSHLFIVLVGAIIGAIITMAVSLHLNITPISYAVFFIIPLAFSFILRKVYIHTLSRITH